MSEEKKKHTLNVNGLEVDFSAVSSDNVPEGTITESLCEELASVLLYKKFISYRGNNCERTGIHKYGEYGLNHKDLHSYVARKSTNANVNTASIYSILKNDSFYKDLTTVRLKYRSIICKEVELFRGIPVWRFLQGIPVQIEDFDQSEV